MIKKKEDSTDNIVINSEYSDIENPWGSSFETIYYTS